MRKFIVLLSLAVSAAATAADIKVLTAGAFKPVIMAEVAAFERETGHKLIVENDTAGALMRRIKAGEAFDLAVLTQAGAQELDGSGLVVAGSGTAVAKVGIGLAVAQGAPRPDISSAEGFKQALLAARSVAVIDPAAGGSSGIYLARLFERMGIAERIRPKAILVPGGLTATRVASGEADVAVQQMSELVGVPGVVLVGALPPDLQNYTVYSAVIGARAADRAAVARFLAVLQSPRVKAALPARGIEAP